MRARRGSRTRAFYASKARPALARRFAGVREVGDDDFVAVPLHAEALGEAGRVERGTDFGVVVEVDEHVARLTAFGRLVAGAFAFRRLAAGAPEFKALGPPVQGR